MEETYPVESYPYVSQLFKPQEYLLGEYVQFLSETLYQKENELKTKNSELEKIACLMDIGLNECEELDKLCRLSLLDSNDAKHTSRAKARTEESEKDEANPEDVLLEKATRSLVTAVEYKAVKSRPLKYTKRLRHLKKTLLPEFVSEPNPSTVVKIPKNMILIARVFRPFNSFAGQQLVSHGQDFMLLGSQSLVSFRDKITCINDQVVVGGNAYGSDSEQVPMKRLLPSGTFYFGNTFYSDDRDVMNKDYSEGIIRWAKSNPDTKLGEFKHCPMEKCNVSDLEIRLGFPYVYKHLGDCEHLITFVDARLMNPDDLQERDEYPLVVDTDSNIVYCSACDTYAASWVVEDDKLPSKPANFCQQCFEVFYTKNGQLVRPFSCCKIPSNDESKSRSNQEEQEPVN